MGPARPPKSLLVAAKVMDSWFKVSAAGAITASTAMAGLATCCSRSAVIQKIQVKFEQHHKYLIEKIREKKRKLSKT